jgi:hypothetical protein
MIIDHQCTNLIDIVKYMEPMKQLVFIGSFFGNDYLLARFVQKCVKTVSKHTTAQFSYVIIIM